MTYRIGQLSVSKVELFTACPRHWWFDFPQGLKPPQTEAQSDGTFAHELTANYLSTGEQPKGRVKLGKVVTQAIAKGIFPVPGPDLLVERRFSGQPMRDAQGKWIPLDHDKAPIWSCGIPWDGFIDVMFRRDHPVTVEDHKFSSDINAPWMPKTSELLQTVQLPIYALVGHTIWPDATQFRLTHNAIPKSAQAEPKKRTVLVTLDQVLERKAQIDQSVEEMKQLAAVTQETAVRARPGKACDDYGGCPHQSRCQAFKERQKVNLSAEELALFEGLDGVVTTATPIQTATPVPAPAVQSVAAVLPPDAPANSKEVPSNGKEASSKKAKKVKILDADPDAVAATPEPVTPALMITGTTITRDATYTPLNLTPLPLATNDVALITWSRETGQLTLNLPALIKAFSK